LGKKKRRTPLKFDVGVLRSKAKTSPLERDADLKIAAAGIDAPTHEQCILPGRRFRFDRVWYPERVALEIHGAYGAKSRHRTSQGFQRDRVKMNLAQIAGWIVIEAGTDHVKSGEFIEWVKDALESRRQ